MRSVRTLITTEGKMPESEIPDIERCFKAAPHAGLWLDIEAPDDDDYRMLAETFKFHPLTIEDIKHQDQRPKIDEYPDYNFAVIFQADWKNEEVAFREHHLYVGAHYLITVHLDPAPALNGLQERLTKSPELSMGQPGFLTYLVIDALVDATFPALEQLDESIDSLEDEITATASRESLQRIYHLKHSVTELRRFLGAQRDVFQRLITHGVHIQQQDMTLYYRDVYDHIVRQYETVDSLRDLLASAMDVYLSTVSNRLNLRITRLTVFATLFLPLTFLTGFFGMNFAWLVGHIAPAWTFWILAVGVMAATAGAQLWYYRRLGWI